MKTSFLPLLALVAMFTFAACQQDDVVTKNTPKMPEFKSQAEFDQYNEKMATMPIPAENTISSRAPINYVGTLYNGPGINYTHTVQGDVSNLATHDYFKFYAQSGDNITLGVTRISCGMDPSMYRYFGLYTDTNLLPAGVFTDDNIADPCASCFGDPGDFFVAATGWYTAGVSDFISCAGPNYDYNIHISGLSTFIVIGGCHTTTLNGQHNATTTMQQAIDNCQANSATSAAFVACVTTLTNTWVSQGKITRAQKSKIITCAQGVPF